MSESPQHIQIGSPDVVRKDLRPYRILTIDLVAGVGFACLLTRAFLEPLRHPGRWAVCAFSFALPLLVAVRHVLENRASVPDIIGVVAIVACVISYVGFLLFITQILPIAVIPFIAGTILAFLISSSYSPVLKHLPSS